MRRSCVLIWSNLLVLSLLACSVRSVSAADEPLPAPKVQKQEVTAPAPNVRRQEEPLPTPNASRQEVPRGVVKLAPPKQPDLSPEAKAAAAKANAKSKGRKPLVAPPGLLSQAPRVRGVTAPGLGKLDLNRATLEQIQRLPGVGETWAPRILAGRPYTTLGDLARVGIPFTTIDALSGVVELGP